MILPHQLRSVVALSTAVVAMCFDIAVSFSHLKFSSYRSASKKWRTIDRISFLGGTSGPSLPLRINFGQHNMNYSSGRILCGAKVHNTRVHLNSIRMFLCTDTAQTSGAIIALTFVQAGSCVLQLCRESVREQRAVGRGAENHGGALAMIST